MPTDEVRAAEAQADKERAVYEAWQVVADLDWHMWGDIAPTLSCTQVEAFADVLRANGETEVADIFIEEHAKEDDEGDAHYKAS